MLEVSSILVKLTMFSFVALRSLPLGAGANEEVNEELLEPRSFLFKDNGIGLTFIGGFKGIFSARFIANLSSLACFVEVPSGAVRYKKVIDQKLTQITICIATYQGPCLQQLRSLLVVEERNL